MPPVAAIPIGLALAGGGLVLGGLAGGAIVGGLAAAMVGIGISTAIGGVLSLLQPSASSPRQRMPNLSQMSEDRLNVWDDPIAFKRLIYGTTRVGGSAVFRHAHGSKKELLTEVVAVADDEINAFAAPGESTPRVWIDGEPIDLVPNIRPEFPSGEFGPWDDWVPDSGGWRQTVGLGPEGIRGAGDTVTGKEGDYWLNTATSRMSKRENAKWILKADFPGSSKQYFSQTAEPSVGVAAGSFWRRTTDDRLFELVIFPPAEISFAKPPQRIWTERARMSASPNFIIEAVEPTPTSKFRAASKEAGEIWFFRIEFRDGRPGQEHHAYVSSVAGGKWTSAHLGEKTASFRYTIRADPNLFRGKPQITVQVRGHLVPAANTSWYVSPGTDPDRINFKDAFGGPNVAHGLSNGNRIAFTHGRLIAPLKRWHNYYVRNAGTTTVQVSETPNGPIVNLTGTSNELSRASRVSYTDNWARCVAHYIAHPYTGLASALPPHLDGLTSINQDVFINSAQVSDQLVTEGGESVPRYTLNGHVDTSTRPMDALRLFEVHGGGAIFHDNVSWHILAGTHRNNMRTFRDTDIYGPITVEPAPGRRDRVNTLVGNFFNPGNGWQPVTTRPVSDADAISNDGGQVLERQIDMTFCDTGPRVRRLLLIALKRLRRQETVTFTTTLSALELVNHDRFRINFEPLLYIGKDFTVESWSYAPLPASHAADADSGDQAGLASEEQEGLGVRLVGIQYDPQIYDDSVQTIEAEIDWRVDVFDPSEVPPPSGLSVFVVEQNPAPSVRSEGGLAADLLVAWTPPDYDWTRRFDVTWRRQGEGLWKSQEVNRTTDETLIRNVVVGDVYDIGVATIGPSGSRSDNRHPYQAQTRVHVALPLSWGIGGPPQSATTGKNLLSNPNFEQGELNWSLNYSFGDLGTSTVIADSSRSLVGPAVLETVLPAGGATNRSRTNEFVPVEWFQKYRYRAWVHWDAGSGLTNVPGFVFLNVLYYDVNKQLITGLTLDRVFTLGYGTPSTPRATWYRLSSNHVPDDPNIRFARFMVRPQNDDPAVANVWLIDGTSIREVIGGSTPIFTPVDSNNTANSPGNLGMDWLTIRSQHVPTPGEDVTIGFNFQHRYGFNASGTTGNDVNPRFRVIRHNSDGVSNETIVMSPIFPLDPYTSNGGSFASNSTSWHAFSITFTETSPPPGSYVYRLQISTDRAAGAVQVRNRDSWYRIE